MLRRGDPGVGGDVGVEILAVGERFQIDVGETADSGVGRDDSAGGKVEVGEGGVCVERVWRRRLS